MNEYFIETDATGLIQGFYIEAVHGDTIPEGCIKVDQTQYDEIQANSLNRLVDGEFINDVKAGELEVPPSALRQLRYKSETDPIKLEYGSEVMMGNTEKADVLLAEFRVKYQQIKDEVPL